jgi:hypothetical protein
MTLKFITNNDEIDDIDNIDNIDDIDNIDYKINQNQNQNENLNPFFVGTKGGNIKQLLYGDIYRNYNSVIIITLSSTVNINDFNSNNIFKEFINEDDIINNGLTYFRTSLNIIKNKQHYERINIISKKYLTKLFQSEDFNESELVLCIFEMNEENTRKYFEFYKSHDELVEIDNKINIMNYYINDDKLKNIINTDNIINSIKESKYWSNKDYLDINITDSFIEREFNSKRNHNNLVVLQDKNNKEKKEKIIIKEGDKEYYDDTDNMTNDNNNNIKKQKKSKKDKDNFIDPALIIKNRPDNGKKKFYTTYIDSTYTNEMICNIFNKITDEKLKYDLLNNLLVSKEYCHLVLNNSKLLESQKELFDKYKNVFKYTFGYAWLTFYLEECVSRTKSTKKSRFSLDINTASKLPVFPFTYSDLKQNPYMTILIDNKEIITNNTYGLSYIENYDGYGVCDLNTFKKRFNIFTSQNPEIDPLKGINWNKFAVSGSSITACLQKRSPLLDECIKQSKDEDEGFNKYIRKYYGESDIDLMSNEQSMTEFLKSVQNVYDLLKQNLNANDNERKYEVVKSCGISITEHFFTYYLDDFNKTYNLNLTSEEFEKKSDQLLFKVYIYHKYILNKNEQIKVILKDNKLDINNKFFQEFLIPNNYDSMNIYRIDSENYDNFNNMDTEIIFRKNDFINNEQKKYKESENKIVIKFSENFRFKLCCKNTNIEMFRIKDKEFFNTVARFHFPCVRAYYNGSNVYMLPSCISAMMTGVNIEYKYFAGIRNPNEIINKYIQRGFGILLNKYEINLWVEYNKSNNLYQNGLGEKLISNKIYQIDNPINIHKYYTSELLKQYYDKFNKNMSIDFTKMKTISENGNINKYCKSYVDYCYEIMN